MLWKTIAFLFPFLKEMFLGDKTIREAVKTNKLRVLVIAMILGSVAVNFLAIPKLIAISYEHVELKRKYKQLDAKVKSSGMLPEPEIVTAPVVEVVASPPVLPVDPTSMGSTDQYQKTKEFFDRLREREAKHQ